MVPWRSVVSSHGGGAVRASVSQRAGQGVTTAPADPLKRRRETGAARGVSVGTTEDQDYDARMVRTPLLACLLLLFVAGCKKSSSSAPPLGTATIGAAGGTLTIADPPISMSVPAGALAGDVAFRVDNGQISKVPGYLDVGTAFAFSPADPAFATPATVVIPFSPSRVPGSVQDAELLIGYRAGTGQVSGLTPQQIDRTAGLATFDATSLGTFWVASPDVVSGASLFPLNDLDSYVYDSGLVVTVSRTQGEPNFTPAEVAKMTFTRAGLVTGLYLDDPAGSLVELGEFEVGRAQERLDSAVLLVADRDTVGTVRPVITTYLGFVPYGSSIVGYAGISRTTTELAERVRVSTPLGAFDTVRVTITTESTESLLHPGTEVLELWLADGVGPVMLRIGESGGVQRLVEATVGGQPVTGG